MKRPAIARRFDRCDEIPGTDICTVFMCSAVDCVSNGRSVDGERQESSQCRMTSLPQTKTGGSTSTRQ